MNEIKHTHPHKGRWRQKGKEIKLNRGGATGRRGEPPATPRTLFRRLESAFRVWLGGSDQGKEIRESRVRPLSADCEVRQRLCKGTTRRGPSGSHQVRAHSGPPCNGKRDRGLVTSFGARAAISRARGRGACAGSL